MDSIANEIAGIQISLPILRQSLEELKKFPDNGQRQDVIHMLISRMFEFSESAIVLIENRHFKSLELIARAVFECHVQVLSLIQNPTACAHYFLFELIEEKRILENGKLYLEKGGRDNLTPKEINDRINQASSGIKNTEEAIKILNGFGIVQKEYQTKSGKPKKCTSWYQNALGISNLRALSAKVKLEHLYVVFYSLWSGSTHSSVVSKGADLVLGPSGYRYNYQSQEFSTSYVEPSINLIRTFIIAVVLEANQAFNVPNFDKLAQTIMNEYKNKGIRFSKSEEIM